MRAKEKRSRVSTDFSGFYGTRRRIYGALLLFVIVGGLPVIVVPKLRNRLILRAWNLTEAAAGRLAPVEVRVGENQEPIPPEFQRPAPPVLPRLVPAPSPARIYSTAQGGYTPGNNKVSRESPANNIDADVSASVQGDVAGKDSESQPDSADIAPKYQQGAVEREAYNLVVSSSPVVADIVKGLNPSFKFLSWDAAGRGDDMYWVRLRLQAKEQPEADYIWQVSLEDKKVIPLNYYARSIQ